MLMALCSYNSVLFASLASYDYDFIQVEPSFFTEDQRTRVPVYNKTDDYYGPVYDRLNEHLLQLLSNYTAGNLDRLSNSDCISEYSRDINSFRSDVLVVLKPGPPMDPDSRGIMQNYTSPDVYDISSYDASWALTDNQFDFYWMCRPSTIDDMCKFHVAEMKSKAANWTLDSGRQVDYCLSMAMEGDCKLQFSPAIAVLVTVLNLFKAIIIFYTALAIKEDPLLTIGDAVASFLETKDHTTQNMCLLSAKEARKGSGYFPAGPKEWKDGTARWKDVTSKARRITTFTMYVFSSHLYQTF